MKLYIDMIAFYLQKAGGITVLWKELIIRMLKNNWDIILILQNKDCNNIYFEEIMLLKPKTIFETGLSVKFIRYRSVECNIEDNSKFISTYYRTIKNKNTKQYTIVHDFTYEYYAKGIKKLVHLTQKKKSIKEADNIICVSQNTKKDLLRLYPWTAGKKTNVIYNGVSEIYKKIEINEKTDDISPFFVYVGSRAKYKRFDLAIAIAAYYNYCLLIVGGGKLSLNEINCLKCKLKSNYIYKSGVSEIELNNFYNKAVALLYPSEYEGFGIPILEAQKAKCPIVARSGSSIDEVVLNDEMLMKNGTLSEGIRVLELYKDKIKRKQILREGYTNALRFSWDKTFEEYGKLLK